MATYLEIHAKTPYLLQDPCQATSLQKKYVWCHPTARIFFLPWEKLSKTVTNHEFMQIDDTYQIQYNIYIIIYILYILDLLFLLLICLLLSTFIRFCLLYCPLL